MLTDVGVRNAKPQDKEYRLSGDGGLFLIVKTNGSKLWRWKYRFGGRERLMSFGAYPDVGIAAARKAHGEAREQLKQGKDPMAKEVVPEAVVNPFSEVAEAWLAKWRVGMNERYARDTEVRLKTDVLSRIGHRPIAKITAPELVEMAVAIEKRGARDIARRSLQNCGQIFRYGITRGLCEQNPASAFHPSDVLQRVTVENFARIDKSDLPALLRKIESYDGAQVRLAMKLMALIFLRTSEMIQGRWSEVNFKEARWDIPKVRMKGGKRPHIVPLSRQSLAVLETLWERRKSEELIFPGSRMSPYMSKNAILKAIEIMGYKGIMTGHGFRGVASTILHEQGYEHEHIEIQLHHGPDDEVSAAYNHAKYLEPRRKMMQDWADFLDKTRDGGRLLPFEGRAAG